MRVYINYLVVDIVPALEMDEQLRFFFVDENVYNFSLTPNMLGITNVNSIVNF